ncbi:hypothetical protein [Fusibacter sp. JL216-2]|uniref:hypothetical protein n=1 Tax=Fusibacter sp. JL216-2 TaxID=3071453 RepID=UPI003D32DD28
MRKRNILLILVLFMVVLVSNCDRHFQFYMLVEKMNSMSEKELDASYGKEVAEVFRLYRENGYNKPRITMIQNTSNESIIRVYATKTKIHSMSHGSVYYSDTYKMFKVEYYHIPILNIEVIKRIGDFR